MVWEGIEGGVDWVEVGFDRWVREERDVGVEGMVG